MKHGKEKPESIRQQRQLLPDHKRFNPDEEDLKWMMDLFQVM